MDGAWLRQRIIDANDGIIATAGIIEGLAGAGATGLTMLIGAVVAMIAGGAALGGAAYTEAASEREAELELIQEERRHIALSPEEALEELTGIYVDRGLSPDLAARVAAELSSHDPVTAHLQIEHGLIAPGRTRPLQVALSAAAAFALGAGIPMMAIVLAPGTLRIPATIVVVVIALFVTSSISARFGGGDLRRVAARSVTIGLSTMLLTLGIGRLFQP